MFLLHSLVVSLQLLCFTWCMQDWMRMVTNACCLHVLSFILTVSWDPIYGQETGNKAHWKTFILLKRDHLFHFITEGAVLELSLSERNKICTSVVQHAKRLNLPLYITTLDRSLGDSYDSCYSHDDSTYNIDDNKEEQLKKLITSVHSLTGKIDLLHKLRYASYLFYFLHWQVDLTIGW